MPTQRHPSFRLTIIIFVALIILAAVMTLFWQPLWALITNPQLLQGSIRQAGPWGPLVFMALQCLQVIIAPIPGQVSGFVGGLAFGAELGTLYSMIGATVGFTAVFVLSRRLGRPFLERFFSARLLRKFDYLVEANGPLVFFLIFLLPAFPDDLICYLAGLTSIRIRTLVLISLAGRLPGYYVLSLAGAGVADSDMTTIATTVTIVMTAFALGVWQRRRLERWVKRLALKS